MKVRKHNTPTVTPMTAKLVLEVGTAVGGSGLNVGECVGAMVGTGVGVPVEGVHVVGVLGTGVGMVGLVVVDPVIAKHMSYQKQLEQLVLRSPSAIYHNLSKDMQAQGPGLQPSFTTQSNTTTME